MQTDSLGFPAVRIRERPSTTEGSCRCGTRIARGDRIFGISGPNPSVATLLDGRPFCSISCIRAWFLETLNELDAIDTPVNERTVVDLRSTFVDLALASVAFVDSRPGVDPSPTRPGRR